MPRRATPRDSLTVVTARQHALLKALGNTHTYSGDGIPDPNGSDRCDHTGCGLPAGHPVHTQEAGQ